MVRLQTTAHVGPDGLLRLEVPTEARDQDVQVELTISSPAEPVEDAYARLRAKLAERPELAARYKLPPPGPRPYTPFTPNDMPGPTASEILIRDRR